MAVRPTVQLGDPLLRTPCVELTDLNAPETRRLADDLRDTLADWVRRTTYGRGIAAPQIGAGVRMVYSTLGEHRVLVNPVITVRSAETWTPWETCLSFSVEFFGKARRARWVDVSYQSLDGEHHSLRATGDLGHLLQHEIDHLDGIVAVDRIAAITTVCMRSEFERRHRDESPYRRPSERSGT
jgi:peptide deformylase